MFILFNSVIGSLEHPQGSHLKGLDIAETLDKDRVKKFEDFSCLAKQF